MYPSVGRVKPVLDRIRYKDWRFDYWWLNGGAAIRVVFEAPNVETGETEIQRGRPWALWPGMTDSDIVRTAFLAIRTAEEHELRELFLFDEAPIFSPHFDAEKLAADWHESHP